MEKSKRGKEGKREKGKKGKEEKKGKKKPKEDHLSPIKSSKCCQLQKISTEDDEKQEPMAPSTRTRSVEPVAARKKTRSTKDPSQVCMTSEMSRNVDGD